MSGTWYVWLVRGKRKPAAWNQRFRLVDLDIRTRDARLCYSIVGRVTDTLFSQRKRDTDKGIAYPLCRILGHSSCFDTRDSASKSETKRHELNLVNLSICKSSYPYSENINNCWKHLVRDQRWSDKTLLTTLDVLDILKFVLNFFWYLFKKFNNFIIFDLLIYIIFERYVSVIINNFLYYLFHFYYHLNNF